MRYVFTIFIFMISFASFAKSDDVVMNSYYDGKRYDFAFSCEQLRQTPIWDSNAGNAPLEARAAVKIARGQLAKLVGDANNWGINKISLRSACSEANWFYVVEFYPSREGLNSGFGIVVLMNSTTVEPRITKWPATP